MLEPQVKAALITSFFILVGFGVNAWLNWKHRNIVAVTQLVKDFYHDLPYVELRIRSLRLIANLPKEECNWKRLMARISHPDTDPEQREMLVAVNRTAAFYLVVRGLIEKHEVNKTMLRSLFGYNYTVYWNCVRMKICDESNDVEDKNLFKKIDELLIPGAKPCDLSAFMDQDMKPALNSQKAQQ